MTEPAVLAAAYVLDLIIGDPRQIPHPVRMLGRGIKSMEHSLRALFKGVRAEKRAGVLLAVTTVCFTYTVSLVLQRILQTYGESSLRFSITFLIFVYLVSTTLATRELIKTTQAVIDSLETDTIETAREKLGHIVGRDTGGLDRKGILRAAIETLSENASDAIIAPLFYFAIGGFPLAMTYKAVNTLDSMVGYNNPRYRNVGWASARVDDAANYVPARITGCLIVLSSIFVQLMKKLTAPGSGDISCYSSLKIMIRDGRKHVSPNSGIPEAAMAGALGVQLGGPSTYGGMTVMKPFIGDRHDEKDYVKASKDAITITKGVSFTGLLCALSVISL